jgi:hypothetical protein
MSGPLADIRQEALRLVSHGENHGIHLRLLGGMAVQIHCQHSNTPGLQRVYPDIDLISDNRSAPNLQDYMQSQGYSPDLEFNTLNGQHRHLYYDTNHQRQVDIFIGDFEMCHFIPVGDRLLIDNPTLPLAELFLTKIQIVQLNEKDLQDLFALLSGHSTGESDNDLINVKVIAGLCARDWGLYTTTTTNLSRLKQYLQWKNLIEDTAVIQKISTRIDSILAEIERTPKSTPWKVRARLGKRVRWYLEVEEVRR